MMRKTRRTLTAAVALATASVVAATAQAHGPTRRKISESIEINAPADKVWAVVGNFKDSNWVDNVAKTEAHGDDPGKSKRTLTLKNGHTIEEEGTNYKPDRMLFGYFIDKIDVADLPVNDFSSNVTVEAEGDGRAKVEWKAAFYRGYMNNDPPPELNDENSEKAVKAWVQKSLANLKAQLEKGAS
ncbi:SRPBCC family protein [Methylobacterium brachythecii]|uniref:MxaD family protein n=1 Tax=Methylobacterium brachythecii TaxID=1176177 RepID=A0A7W6F6R0_9HYPH|nr:hypothetical protein [Methylobacterium brachythecii]GLS42458.1 MxaD family protein [Methylobacterium brachythecii]